MKHTTETFINKAKEIHGDKYDYSQVIYINNQTHISIICRTRGIFNQISANHIRKKNPRGCPNCAKNKKLTTETFIDKANKIHKNKYDYSLVKYENSLKDIKIICPIHGVFIQKPYIHLQNYGCQLCGNNLKLTTETFIDKANKIHNNKYNYSLVVYKNSHIIIDIICPEHGIFKQKPNNHLSGQGCNICSNINRNNKIIEKAKISFIEKAKNIHGEKYDYSLAEYKGNRLKIDIICPEHGVFKQKANSHLSGHGCPNCNISRGEEKIKECLEKNKIIYVFQKSFNDCVNDNNNKLKYDFYLPEKNILIEYDGKHHFQPIEYFGGTDSFNITKKYDSMKNVYAEKNKITLIRIPYYKYKIIDKIINDI